MGKDPETGKARFKFIEDDDVRDSLPTVGYMAYFEYMNGFRKVLYWSKEKMMNHADTYSPAFSRKGYEDLLAGKVPQGEMWKYSSFWYKNFDDMAKKTMLRQLISRWGVMSIDIQTALEHDDTITHDNDGQLIAERVASAKDVRLEAAAQPAPQLEQLQTEQAVEAPTTAAEPKKIDLSSL